MALTTVTSIISLIIISLFMSLGFGYYQNDLHAQAWKDITKNKPIPNGNPLAKVCEGANNVEDSGYCEPDDGPGYTKDKLVEVIQLVTAIVYSLIGIISVIMIIVSGIRFVTSNGNAEKVASARKGLLYAIVGLVLAMFTAFIVQLTIGLGLD